jgi:hypothetical protein
VDGASSVRARHEFGRLVGLHYPTSGNELAVAPQGSHRFRVIWGNPFRDVTQEIVTAFDIDEALVTAHERHPELPLPRTAFLVNETH